MAEMKQAANLATQHQKNQQKFKQDSDSSDDENAAVNEEISKGMQLEKDKFIKKHALSSHQQSQI